MPDQPTTVYISYAKEDGLQQWVEVLATRLRTQDGIDATLRDWELYPGDQIPKHLEDAVRENSFIVLVCTPEYRRQFDKGIGETGYIAQVITGEILHEYKHGKYVAVVREGRDKDVVPVALLNTGVVDLRGEPYAEDEYRRLAGTLGRKPIDKPSIAGGGSLPADTDLAPLLSWGHLNWRDFYARCTPRIGLVRESIRSKLEIFSGSPDDSDIENIPLDLDENWRRFVSSETWKTTCTRLTGELKKSAERYSEYPEAQAYRRTLDEIARGLSAQEPYINLRHKFRPAVTKDLLRKAGDLRMEVLSRIGRRSPERPNAEAAMGHLVARTMELVKAGTELVFRRCFLLAGGMGAGKTHFLANVVLAVPEDEGESVLDAAKWLPVWLDRSPQPGKFVDQLLDAVRWTTNIEWPSVGKFCETVSSWQPQAKVVFVLDDLHKWIDLDTSVPAQLCSAIESMTSYESVHWLISMNDRAYADIALQTGRIWAAYCDREPNRFHEPQSSLAPGEGSTNSPRSGGWYLLDEIVARQEVGMEILKRFSDAVGFVEEPGETEEDDKDTGEDNEAVTVVPSGLPLETLSLSEEWRRDLSNPLIAKVLAAAAAKSGFDIASILNGRFADFIERLRALLVDRSLDEYDPARGSEARLLIEQAIDYTARAFALWGKPDRPLLGLRQEIMDNAAGVSFLVEPARLSNTLAALKRAHLMEISQRPAPDGITRIEWASLRLDPFWEYHLALHELALKANRPVAGVGGELQKWLDGFSAPRLRAGVAQFLFIHSDARHPALAGELWGNALNAQQLPLQSALDAAVHSTPERQKDIADRVLRQKLKAAAADELLSLIRFVRLAARDAVTPPERTAILQPYYESIGNAGLGDYASFALSHVIAQARNMKAMQKVLVSLEGSEMLGSADDLAGLCIERIMAIVGETNTDPLVESLITYATTPSRLGQDHESRMRDKMAENIKGRDRYLFRHWLFDRACHWIADQRGVDAYEYLWRRKWYSRAARFHDVTPWISTEMEKFANFAIGDVSQESVELRQQLRLLVTELVEAGDVDARRNAFYLIRHSEPIPIPNMAVRVNPMFHEALRAIAADPRLKVREQARDFLELNLGVLPPIDSRRPAGKGRQERAPKRRRK